MGLVGYAVEKEGVWALRLCDVMVEKTKKRHGDEWGGS